MTPWNKGTLCTWHGVPCRSVSVSNLLWIMFTMFSCNYTAVSHNITDSPCTSTCTPHPTLPSPLPQTSYYTQLTNTRHRWKNGKRCRDVVKLLWFHSLAGSIHCFHSEKFLWLHKVATQLSVLINEVKNKISYLSCGKKFDISLTVLHLSWGLQSHIPGSSKICIGCYHHQKVYKMCVILVWVPPPLSSLLKKYGCMIEFYPDLSL